MDAQIAKNEVAIEGKQPKGNYPTKAEMSEAIANAQLGGDGNKATKPLRVVFVGNSFSLNATKYAYDVLTNLGYSDFVIGVAYRGSCSLAMHLNSLKTNKADYEYRVCISEGQKNMGTKTLHDILTAESWDVVILQQKSGDTDNADTYEDVYEVLNYCKKYCPDAKFGWHMTWQNKNAIYEDIISVVKDKILRNAFFEFIIPNGTAVQNASTSYLDDSIIWDDDDLHLEDVHPFGKFVATLGTIKSLLCEKVDLNDITYKSTLTDEEFEIAKESVSNMYARPFEVTASIHAVRDEDVTAFLTATGISDVDMALKLDTMVTSLKNEGLWDKIDALYPCVGSTFEQMSYNLKDTNTYRLSSYGDGNVSIGKDDYFYASSTTNPIVSATPTELGSDYHLMGCSGTDRNSKSDGIIFPAPACKNGGSRKGIALLIGTDHFSLRTSSSALWKKTYTSPDTPPDALGIAIGSLPYGIVYNGEDIGATKTGTPSVTVWPEEGFIYNGANATDNFPHVSYFNRTRLAGFGKAMTIAEMQKYSQILNTFKNAY